MVSVDENLCTGCQVCVSVAPETFEMNDSGVAEAISDEVTPEAEQAQQQCPVDAISL
ncbi:MAG: ferredoxin [Haloarculaceae archaeon]